MHHTVSLLIRSTVVSSALALTPLLPTAHASTVEAQLVVLQTAPNLFDVQVWARTANSAADFPRGDGGIRGLQFDILSAGTGLSTPVTASSTTDPQSRPQVRTLWPATITSNFTATTPLLLDARTFRSYPFDNPDPDALGGAFIDVSSFTWTTLGIDNAYTLIATEQWQLTDAGLSTGDHLDLYLVGPTYYDYSATTSRSLRDFTSAVTHGADIPPIPEPSLSLLALLSLPLLCRHRHRPPQLSLTSETQSYFSIFSLF